MTQQNPQPIRRAFSILEFGKTYGVSRSLTYQLMDTGTLESVKVGARRLIPTDAAEAWFQSLRSPSRPSE